MTELSDPRGFEDLWRQLDPPRRFTRGGLNAVAIRAHLRLLVARAPQAAVTNYARPTSLRSLRTHLDYISRKGELPLIGRDDQRLEGREAILRRADDWVMDQFRFRGGVALAYTMTLSMPPGTPAEPVERAARAFAAQEYAGHDALRVLHLDRPHPHVHLAVRGEDDEGRSRPITSADLYRFPEVFAEKLRAEGVEADGSPRWQRGVVLRPEHQKVRKAREDFEAGRAPAPRVLVENHRQALDIARGLETDPRKWEALMIERQRRVREGYLSLADRLDAMNEIGDQRLAIALRQFVADMPPVRTKREILVEQAREYDGRMYRDKQMEQTIEPPLRDR